MTDSTDETTVHVIDSPTEGSARVIVTGELDMFSCSTLRNSLAALDAAGRSRIAVDFAAVTFIDSAGIGVLVGALRKAKERGATITVEDCRPPIRKVFEITHLAQAFDVGES